MALKITILVENTTPIPGLMGEYGLALLVETDNKRFLFDTGSQRAIIHNSKTLGVDLDKLDGIIISHGHFDHTGGLLPIMEEHKVPVIYAHSRVFAHRPLPLGNGRSKEIGCLFSLSDLEKTETRMVYVDTFTEIEPQMYLSGEVPRITNYENVGGNFMVEVDGQLMEDRLEDDIALIFKLEQGLVIISGCAHSGIINIIEHAMEKTGEKRILAFIGGTHLITAAPSRLDETIAALKSYAIDKIVVSHCTGFYAAARLYNELGDKVVKGEVGMSYSF